MIGFIFMGILTGFASGIFGIGGGVIIVPALMFFYSFNQFQATGTSLVAMLLPVGLLGVGNYYTAGKISVDDVKTGLLIGAGIFLGAYLGSKFAVGLKSIYLTRAFSVFLVVIAIRLWFSK